MKEADPRRPANEMPADRLSRMAEACLRIASNLDIDAVLQEVIDAARSLTGARYGALVSFDDSGDIRDLVTSGMTPEERRRMGGLPKGLGLLGYLNEVPRPLTVTTWTLRIASQSTFATSSRWSPLSPHGRRRTKAMTPSSLSPATATDWPRPGTRR